MVPALIMWINLVILQNAIVKSDSSGSVRGSGEIISASSWFGDLGNSFRSSLLISQGDHGVHP
jgi:hypothetical protein